MIILAFSNTYIPKNTTKLHLIFTYHLRSTYVCVSTSAWELGSPMDGAKIYAIESLHLDAHKV